MMLACQSEEGLAKTQDERTRILKTSHLLILHTCNAPERLIERAGKQKQLTTGWSMRGEEGTSYATMNMRDEYIIPPDEARRLHVDECFVIAQGYGYKFHIAPIQTDPASLAEAEAEIAQEEATVSHLPIGYAYQTNPTQEDDRQRETDELDLL